MDVSVKKFEVKKKQYYWNVKKESEKVYVIKTISIKLFG